MDRSHAYALDRLNRTRTARRERAARRRRNPRLGALGVESRPASPAATTPCCVTCLTEEVLLGLSGQTFAVWRFYDILKRASTRTPRGHVANSLLLLRVSRGTQFRTSVPKETLQGPACDSSGETGEQNRHIGKGSDSGRKGYLLYERSRGDRSTGEVIYWSSTQHSQC